jgi:hypothetical protein
MPAVKYLSRVAGRIREIAGTVISAGAADDGKLVSLDASGKIDVSVLPAGVGQNTVALVASEALSANDLVNIWNDVGTAKVRRADGATEGREVHGFVRAAFALNASATVFLPGNVMTGLTGLTPGARQFLATTAGGRTETPLAATGNVSQMIGIAATATSIVFEPEEPITVQA